MRRAPVVREGEIIMAFPKSDPLAALSEEDQQILREQVLDLNDTLVTQSINLAAQAFNNAFRLGCAVLFIPVVIVLVISYTMDRFSMISIIVYGGLGALIAAGFGALVANRAKYLAIKDNYEQDITPQIKTFLKEHDMTRRQFDTMADDVLADNAPLRDYIIPVGSQEG